MREHTVEEWVSTYAPRTIGEESELPESLRALFSLTDNGEALITLSDLQSSTEEAEARSEKLSELIRDVITICQSLDPDETAESLSEAIVEVIGDSGEVI